MHDANPRNAERHYAKEAFGGPEGIRTPDLVSAIHARSQLRHGPTLVLEGEYTRAPILARSGLVLQKQTRAGGCRPCPHTARPDPHRPRPLAAASLRPCAESRHREMGLQRLRRGGETVEARLPRAAG